MKIIRIAAILLFVLTAAGFAWKEAVVKTLLTIQAKELITPTFIAKLAERQKYVYESGLTFDGLYDDARTEVYLATFLKEMGGDASHQDDYYAYRTVAVSVFRTQLHQGNMLEEVYEQVRDSYMDAVKKSKADERTGLIKLLSRASGIFTTVEKKESRQQLVKTLSVVENPDYALHCNLILAKRLSPEQTLKAIGQPPTEVDPRTAPRAVDPDGLKRFALRRFDEGGTALVKKYQIVIARALADAIAADEAAGLEKL